MDDTSGMTADGEHRLSGSSVSPGHSVEADMSLNGLQDELQRLGEDRSSLAATLDTAETRVARLEDANREVSRRLVSAMESIRSVLETHGG